MSRFVVDTLLYSTQKEISPRLLRRDIQRLGKLENYFLAALLLAGTVIADGDVLAVIIL